MDETTDASDHEEELDTDVQITVINNENTQTISVVENIQENLPEYTSINQTPNKTYNNMDGTTFNNLINKFYDESVKFRKNLFLVPTGNSGKEYVKLLTEWMTNYNSGNTFHGIAMKVVMTLPNLLLQKPSAKSKAKEHTAALERRLRLWREGELTDIWKECLIIQKKLTTTKPQRSQEDISRTFSKLMFEGKVGPALRFLEENADNAVLSPTNEVIAKLQALHPASEEISPNTLIAGPLQPINTAYLLSIDEEEILKAANRTTGSAGPSMFDAKQWKRILVSKKYRSEGKDLREAIAMFARKIGTEILDPNTLECYVAGRLIALNKAPGEEVLQVRPIGVGEVLRRIVGKTISWCLGQEIQEAGGPLQVSTGLKGGAEAAIHAMKRIYDEETTNAVILVDASNAFNRLNRRAALHNIQYLCPPFSTVLINTYRLPARLFLSGGAEISSEEGTTQGDTLAMAFYGIGTNPILRILRQQVPEVKQVWLADDATGAGKLAPLKEWWVKIAKEGTKFGYHVKPSKSWLVLKDSNKLQQTEELFRDFPINITVEGKRHLGAAIGTLDFKNKYMSEKVNKWCTEMENLTEVAKSQPHAAYSAFIHGQQHKFTYFLRTIAGISSCLEPLDDIINNKFIPTLFGREVSESEREIISLPIREGGLGLRYVSKNADQSYRASSQITRLLIKHIMEQSDELPDATQELIDKKTTTTEQKTAETTRATNIKSQQTAELQRTLDQFSQPGASSWLGALPIAAQGFDLNKGEFQDALCMRYLMPIRNLPSHCPCGSKFDQTHALNCMRGGFVNARHDNIRDFECKLLQSICTDVESEPHLQPIQNKSTYTASANTEDNARLDIRARGFWRRGQNAFFDVRVTNADNISQQNTRLDSVLKKHETEKKKKYNRRVMEVEHGSFTPLVFTTSGVMSHECSKFHKALAEKISTKKDERYDTIMRYLRVKLSFLSLKSTLLCLRGTRRGKGNLGSGEDFGFTLDELGL